MHSRIQTVVGSLVALFLICHCLHAQQAFNKFKADLRSFGKEALVRIRPSTGRDTQIETLAREIDWLEAHIDKFGSVVAKQPDIWGESRLTKYRSEFENEMIKRLGCFQVRENASISRSDLAFLASATGISAAISDPVEPSVNTSMNLSGTTNTNSVEADSQPATPPLPSINQDITIGRGTFPESKNSATAATNLDIVEELNQQARFINHLHQLRRINSGDDTSDAPGYALNLVRIPISVTPGRETRRGYGARATITASLTTGDALLPETFRSLVINDIVDQLALPVLKLAESPGLEFTRLAQIFDHKNGETVKRIEAVVEQVKGESPDNYLIADLIRDMFQQHSPSENLKQLREMTRQATVALFHQRDMLKCQINETHLSCTDELSNLRKRQNEANESIRDIYESVILTHFIVLDELCGLGTQGTECRRIEADFTSYLRTIDGDCFSDDSVLLQASDEQYLQLRNMVGDTARMALGGHDFQEGDLTRRAATLPIRQLRRAVPLKAIKLFESIYDDYFQFGQVSVNPVSRRRRSTMPVPQVLLETAIGREVLVDIALRFSESYRGQMVAWNERSGAPKFHLADVRHYLQGNLDMAYRMLMQADNLEHVRAMIEPGVTPRGLAAEVSLAHMSIVANLRRQLMTNLALPSIGDGSQADQARNPQPTIMQSLAWPVLVEMALLNEQLNQDVQAIASTRNDCGCHPGMKHAYYLPLPAENSAEDPDFQAATLQFQEYVRCRWPIHVFHVDPVNQDQNVSASSIVQRELAIAVSLGVASGNLNVRQANQFVRQYQESIDTIDLNRTINGFAHGPSTFGWEFRPRIQITPNRSTFAVFGETLFGRFADANKRDAALEPGIRECTAIVLMPSFVPYCDFDVSTTWFRLDNPRSTEISTHATVKLSRSVRKMRDCALSCSECAHLYRDGETERLLRRVSQLEQQIPLQSMRAQIPYENTLGGFEMFSNGVTDLAPELVGWYGAPGVYVSDDGIFCCPGNCKSNPADEDPCVRVADPPADGSATKLCSVDPASAAQGSGTSIFLVGDNFSVHETRFIAGGVTIPSQHVKMISRQVVEINIPTCVATVVLDKKEFVAVYASTPYGVTSHLHVPIIKKKEGVISLCSGCQQVNDCTQSVLTTSQDVDGDDD